jgi:amidase
MQDILNISALELSRQIARRTLAPSEVMAAVLSRIADVNPALNAIISMRDPDELMAQARAADDATPQGWLHGIPWAVKDLVATKGIRSTWGSPLRKDLIPLIDDPIVTSLKSAGAIIIGKTNTPEFGLGSHSFNPLFGVTRNPYDATRTAGGSSGGAGAALAARMLPLADGSDMMGSLRNPAAWNCVYSLRPTAGTVPDGPNSTPYSHTLSTLGPMARDVADLEALQVTLSGGHHRAVAQPDAALRIGWLGDWDGAFPMDPDLLAQNATALATFRDLGCAVSNVAPPMDAEDLWRSWIDLRSVTIGWDKGQYHGTPDWDQLKPEMQWEITRGITMPGAQLQAALALRRNWLAVLDRLWSQFDMLVLPATQVWPFPVEWRYPAEIAGQKMDTYHRWMHVVVPVALAGIPAVTLPTGFGANGLASGVQVFGPASSDAQLLALARRYQGAVDWTASHPPTL